MADVSVRGRSGWLVRRRRSEYRTGTSLGCQPASTGRVHAKYGEEEIRAFSDHLKAIAPERR